MGKGKGGGGGGGGGGGKDVSDFGLFTMLLNNVHFRTKKMVVEVEKKVAETTKKVVVITKKVVERRVARSEL